MEKITNIGLGICAIGIAFISLTQLLAGGSKVFLVPIIGVAFWGMIKIICKNIEEL